MYSGLHLAVIHSLMELLEQLLLIATRDPRLRPVLDEQNGLFQVGVQPRLFPSFSVGQHALNRSVGCFVLVWVFLIR